ncbi:helix-turn-helix domain-containing protein [Curtobacterium luteum]|uniref:AraC family transcriptional regulator n=1 Tax=Curtobacterium luteum TaxID=33881 RepID=UPI0038213021
MPDALQALIDIAGVRCAFGRSLLSAAPDWTLDLDPDVTAWVVTLHVPVVLHRAGRFWVLQPGCAALLRHGAAMSVGTSTEVHGPPVDTDPLWPRPTGVTIGSVTLGPLADEALALPPFLETQPSAAPEPSVVAAAREVDSLPVRWGRAQADALARLVVSTVLRHGPPPVLAADNSLGAVLDVLFDATRAVPVAELLAVTGMSERTLHRRFREATGCAPVQLGRWYRALAVRAALLAGDTPDAVAARYGYASVSAMRRSLGRVRAPGGHPPPA